MSYFIAVKTPFGKKARNRWLYPTKQDARQYIKGFSHEVQEMLSVEDAEHEPGRSILNARHGFA